jgi:hypothetical protein
MNTLFTLEVVLSLIWNSGLASDVQFPVALVIAMAQTCEQLSDAQALAYRYRRNSYRFML